MTSGLQLPSVFNLGSAPAPPAPLSPPVLLTVTTSAVAGARVSLWNFVHILGPWLVNMQEPRGFMVGSCPGQRLVLASVVSAPLGEEVSF